MGNNLAQRVRNNTGGQGSTSVATTDSSTESRPTTLGQQIQQMESSFQMAMPRGAEAAQLIRDAMTCLRMTPKLANCDPQSVLGALMTCAQLGLRPGVLGHAWLLPFWDSRMTRIDDKGRTISGGHRAQLVIGYQGLVELAHRSGQIKSLIARTVYQNDTFEIEYGLDEKLVHRPAMNGTRGEPIAYYAVVKFVTGGHAFLVMSQQEMEEHRDRYAMAKTKEGKIVGPWVDNFEGMALKTCVRQLSKWMPKSTDYASAIEADGTVRVDVTPNKDAMLHGERPDDAIDGEFTVDDTPSGETAANGETAADAPAEPEVDEPARQPQLAKLNFLLGQLGVTDDDEKHRVLGIMLKRPIASQKDTTRPEISGVLDLLQQISEQTNAADVFASTLRQLEAATAQDAEQ